MTTPLRKYYASLKVFLRALEKESSPATSGDQGCGARCHDPSVITRSAARASVVE